MPRRKIQMSRSYSTNLVRRAPSLRRAWACSVNSESKLSDKGVEMQASKVLTRSPPNTAASTSAQTTTSSTIFPVNPRTLLTVALIRQKLKPKSAIKQRSATRKPRSAKERCQRPATRKPSSSNMRCQRTATRKPSRSKL